MAAFDALDKRVAARSERLGDAEMRAFIAATMKSGEADPQEKLEVGWLLLKANLDEPAAQTLTAAEQGLRDREPEGESHLLALVALGRVNRRLGRREEARAQLEEAIRLGTPAGPSLILALARVNLATVLEDDELEAEAGAAVDAANEEYLSLGAVDSESIAAALVGGRIAVRTGRTEHALATLERGVRLEEKHNGRSTTLVALRLALVAALAQAGYHGEAEVNFEQAMDTVAALDPSPALLGTLATLAPELNLVEEHERAATVWQAALGIDATLHPGDPPHSALLQNLGLSLGRIGQLDEAVEHLQAALKLREDPGVRAKILSNLGSIYEQRGDLGLALNCLSEADAIQQLIDPRSREAARKRNNLGGIYNSLGQHVLALFCYREALDLHEEADRRLDRPSGNTANTMGGVAQQLMLFGNLEEARPYYEQRVSIWQELAPGSGEAAAALTHLGSLCFRAGEETAARKHLAEAVARFETLGRATPDAGDAFYLLGTIERQTGRRDAARRHLERSLELRRRSGADGMEVAGSLTSLGELEREEGELDDAVTHFEDGVAQAEAARRRAGANEARISNFGRIQEVYQGLIGTLYERGRPGDASRAFAMAEASRSRGLLELIAGPTTDPPAELVEAEDRWAAAEATFRAAEAAATDEPEMYRLAVEVARSEDALNQVRGRLLDSDEEGPAPFGLEEVQAELDERTLLLEYDATGGETFVWAVRDGEALMVPLQAGAEELAEDVRWVVGGYGKTAGSRETMGRRRRLAEKLLGPVPAEMWEGVERLFVVPDGVLHELPFDLLPHGENGELLLDRTAVTGAPSATVAALLGRRPATPAGAAELLAFGDPAPSEQSALPGARAEAEAVGERFAGKAQLLLAQEATKAAFAAAAPTADIIHLATHGTVDQQQPLQSGLLFRDGLLRTYEIPRVRLDSPLVVCSACESGLGRTFSGEGLLGLSRALLGAGARCVIGSLWRVHDEATRELMVGFYDGLLAGRPVPEALRDAKLAVREQYPDPYYWSAFVPIGAAI